MSIIEENLDVIHESLSLSGCIVVDDNKETVTLHESVVFESGVVVTEDMNIRLLIAAQSSGISYIFQFFTGISPDTAAEIAILFSKALDEQNESTKLQDDITGCDN